MKYGLRCAVTSKIRLARKQICKWDDFEIEIDTNVDGFFAHISVVANGQDVGKCETTHASFGGTSTTAVTLRRNEELHRRLLHTLQSVESFLALYADLENIHWNSVEAFFEPESDGEARPKQIAVQITPDFYIPEIRFEHHEMDWLIAKASRCRSLATTLSFYREGLNDVRQRRNISAFFNFYFVLEGFYANGKFHTKDVLREFKRSTILTTAIREVIKAGFHPSMDEDEGILDWLRRIAKPCDVDGIINLLVTARGELHHYAGPKVSKGSPLTNERFMRYLN